MAQRERIVHSIPPTFDERSRVLVLGTMPSPASREAGFNYGHPRNRFWTVMAQLAGEALPIGTERRRDFCLRHHIALWDVLAECDIEGASDASISNAVPNRLTDITKAAPIEAVFCTGAKSFELYNRYCADEVGIPAIKLPSTSPANAACSTERLLQEYAAIFEHEHRFEPPTLEVADVVALEQTIAANGTSLFELMDRAGHAVAWRVQGILEELEKGAYTSGRSGFSAAGDGVTGAASAAGDGVERAPSSADAGSPVAASAAGADASVPAAASAAGADLAGALSDAGSNLAETPSASSAPCHSEEAPSNLVTILCGNGNNGGDGWVAAALLAQRGVNVGIVCAKLPEALTAQPAHDAAIRALATLEELGCRILDADGISDEFASPNAHPNSIETANVNVEVAKVSHPEPTESMGADAVVDASFSPNVQNHWIRTPFVLVDDGSPECRQAVEHALATSLVVVDAIMGTGAAKAPRSPFREWVISANALREHHVTLAVDVPTGIDANTGEVADPHLPADETITMIVRKAGLLPDACGPVTVAPLAYIEPFVK